MLTFFACNKEEKQADNTLNKKVTFNEFLPDTDAVYQIGDSVFFHVSVSALQDMHGYELSVINMRNNAEVYYKAAHTHGKQIEFNDYWLSSELQEATTFEATFSIALSHSGDKAQKVVRFSCK